MDIYNVYLGEGYGSLRNPITFRDYEKHPYGSWEKNANKACYQNKNSYSGKWKWRKMSTDWAFVLNEKQLARPTLISWVFIARI